MGALMALIPIAAVLLTALSRVHAVRGATIEGTVQRELSLTFMERMGTTAFRSMRWLRCS